MPPFSLPPQTDANSYATYIALAGERDISDIALARIFVLIDHASEIGFNPFNFEAQWEKPFEEVLNWIVRSQESGGRAYTMLQRRIVNSPALANVLSGASLQQSLKLSRSTKYLIPDLTALRVVRLEYNTLDDKETMRSKSVLLAQGFAELKRAISRHLTFNGRPVGDDGAYRIGQKIGQAVAQVEDQAICNYKHLQSMYAFAPHLLASLPHDIFLLAAVGGWVLRGHAGWSAFRGLSAPFVDNLIDDAVDREEEREGPEDIVSGMDLDDLVSAIPVLFDSATLFDWSTSALFLKDSAAFDDFHILRCSLDDGSIGREKVVRAFVR